jgi:hypothetical protein
VRPLAAVVATATCLLLALSGCSVPGAVEASSSPTPTRSAAPAASEPLTCDELVPADLVAAALEGGDGVPVEPVVATKDGSVFDAVLLEGAGGLPCSWRVGSGMPEYNAPSDWAYLRVDVLPGAADQWKPIVFGEAPSTDTREIAGIEASVGGGDAGWAISAPVGDSWVVATISAAAHTSTGDRFAGLPVAVIADRLADVAEAAFTTVLQASAAQLDWTPVELRQTDPVCNGGLDEQGVLAALQVPAESAVEYVMTDAAAASPPWQFGDAVRAAARAFECDVIVDGIPEVMITTARGFSPLFARFRGPDADVALSPLELADTPPGTEAVAGGTRRASVVYLSLGGTLYRIAGEGAPAVAQAIVAQTY